MLIRLSEEEGAALEELRRDVGAKSCTEVVRRLCAEAAERYGSGVRGGNPHRSVLVNILKGAKSIPARRASPATDEILTNRDVETWISELDAEARDSTKDA